MRRRLLAIPLVGLLVATTALTRSDRPTPEVVPVDRPLQAVGLLRPLVLGPVVHRTGPRVHRRRPGLPVPSHLGDARLPRWIGAVTLHRGPTLAG